MSVRVFLEYFSYQAAAGKENNNKKRLNALDLEYQPFSK